MNHALTPFLALHNNPIPQIKKSNQINAINYSEPAVRLDSVRAV
jgi:hypothetical protein